MAAGLRAKGLGVQLPTGHRSLKAQMRAADASSAPPRPHPGGDELARPDPIGTLRDLATGEQREVALENVASVIRGPTGSM